MIGTELLSKLIRSVILSGRVKRTDINPVSVFLVAPVERGKTTLILENSGHEPVVLTDVSGIGLLETLQQNKDATHVLINDLTCVGGHKQSVATLTISILNSLAEEGTYKIGLPRMLHLDLRGRKVGIIACCTPSLYKDNRRWWKQSGFASRLLVIQYDHSEELKLRILKAISNDNGVEEEKKSTSPPIFKIPAAPIYVLIPEKESAQILEISNQVAGYHEEIGYRKEKQLRAIACGHALLRTWKNPCVNQLDVSFLRETIPFICLEYNEKEKTHEVKKI